MSPTAPIKDEAFGPEGPAGYAALLDVLKGRIHAARLRAALSANRKLILLYWQIGRDIRTRQQAEG